MTTHDVEKIVQEQIAQALASIGGVTNLPSNAATGQPVQLSFEGALAQVDPRDSEAALAMLDFLLTTGRLNRVGTLDGGQGYLFVYREPKGASKQGYVPGGTTGDRMVDAAVEQARAEGKKPAKKGICGHCLSVVIEDVESGVVYREDGELGEADGGTRVGSDVCGKSPDGNHMLV